MPVTQNPGVSVTSLQGLPPERILAGPAEARGAGGIGPANGPSRPAPAAAEAVATGSKGKPLLT